MAGADGWAAVGGAEQLASALHELVTLPLQVCAGMSLLDTALAPAT